MSKSIEEILIARLEFQELCEVHPIKEPLTKAALDLLERDIVTEPKAKPVKPYTKRQLSLIRKMLKDFCVPNEMYAAVPATVVTYNELLNWKDRIIKQVLDQYN